MKAASVYEDRGLITYMRELSGLSPISREEEIVLAKRMEAGDEGAMTKLIKSNLRLVVMLARHYVTEVYPLLDAIQDGNLGLLYAARKFDYRKGVKFASYAAFWIRQYMLRGLRTRQNIVKLPYRKEVLQMHIKKAYNMLKEKFNRMPTTDEIADTVVSDRVLVSSILNLTRPNVSLDQDIVEMDRLNLMNGISDAFNPQKQTIDAVVKEETKKMLKALSDKERYVIENRFGLFNKPKLTLKEIATGFGITTEAVRQIEKRAIAKLKKQFSHLRDIIENN